MSTIESIAERVTLNVTGMTCGSCARHVRKALERIPGYREATVDLATGRVDVSYESGSVSPDSLIAAVGTAGYAAELALEPTEIRPLSAGSCGCCAPRSS